MRTPRTIICASPDCEPPAWSLGFCGQCIQRLRLEQPEEVGRLESLTLEERRHENHLTKHGLPFPKWEWLGDEEALIKVFGSQTGKAVKIGRH